MTRPLAAVLACVLLTTACGASPEETPDGSGTGAPAETAPTGAGLTVVATVFPLAWIAAEVAPGADLAFLGARGQDPHDLEMSPADRERIETADVLLYMGDLDFQPQVEQAAHSAAGVVVDVADVAGHARLLDFDHDDDHEDDDGHGHDEADGEVFDPHVWFDGRVMADVAREAGAMFAAADPDHAAGYETNASAIAEGLDAVADDIDALLADCRHDTAIVSHEAYAYLLEPRGLRQEGISGTGGHAEASPQRLAELTARIQEEGIGAVAAEPIEGRGDAEALAAEAGVELVEIDPLEVATEDEFKVGYIELLRQQAEAFADVLECG